MNDAVLRKILNTGLLFMIMFGISLLWVLYNFPYTPEQAIEDGARLGKWGILIDIVVIGALAKIWLTKKKAQE
jgi:hypothetical protein